ncbi:small heat shock protein, chloroplastic-like [Oryza brachyantha]|uniref:small heat shock protein, chloroplastic-like n=1 Tax=Oryza brachyantha TaxID=4533 RepID=UPI001ADACB47|nr:small heat shock protein, chloroplastic-like [Oryza brachyantha]
MMMHQQAAVVSNLRPSPGAGGLPWVAASCRPARGGSVRVRCVRNGSTESLDHLQRAPKGRPQQQQQQGAPAPGPRRRVIRTAPFGLWDSFPEARTLDQMMRTMERIMDGDAADDRMLVVPASAVTAAPAAARAVDTAAAAAARRGRTPWEIKERAGAYLVRYDMPGMTREDVRVSVQDRTLVVAAEKAAKEEAADAGGEEEDEGEGEGEAWPAASFGRYRTRVELPENVEVERIAAEVKDGVLYLTIPKVASGGKVVSIQVH